MLVWVCVWPGDRGLMCKGSADLQSSVRSRSLWVHCLYVGRPDPANNKAVADGVAEDLEKSSKVLHLHNPIYRRLYPEWIYWKSMELICYPEAGFHIRRVGRF